MLYLGQKSSLESLDGFLDSSDEIFLSLGILGCEAEQEVAVLLDLLLLEHLVVEEQLAEDDRGLVLDLQPLRLGENLLGDWAVDQALLHLDELEEDVNPLLLALVHIAVDHKPGDAAGQLLLGALRDGLVAGVLDPLSLVLAPVVILGISVTPGLLGLVLLLLGPVLLLGLGGSLGVDVLLRRVLDDVGGQLVAHVDGEDVAAGLAGGADHVLLDLENGLGVVALLAEDEPLDEAIQHVLHLGSVVATVDDVPEGEF